jgi:hypothetical protein
MPLLMSASIGATRIMVMNKDNRNGTMMAEASFAPLKTITTPAASNIEPPILAPGLVTSSLIKNLLLVIWVYSL